MEFEPTILQVSGRRDTLHPHTARCSVRLTNCALCMFTVLNHIMYMYSCIVLIAPSVQSPSIRTLTRRFTGNMFPSHANAPFVCISWDCTFFLTFLETLETCIMSTPMTGDWWLMTDDFCSSLNVRAILKSERVQWADYGVRMGLKRNVYSIWVRKPAGGGLLGRSRRRWVAILIWMLKEYYGGPVVD